MNINLEKISPWNWFKKEGANEVLPVSYRQPKLTMPLRQLHQEIEQVFNDFLPGPWPLVDKIDDWPNMTKAFKPLLDIKELDDKYHIEVDVPGADKNDIKIEVQDDTLKIYGEKSKDKEESNGNYHRMERSYGAFLRTLVLPENADKDDINVHYEDGVLKIDINKDTDINPEALTRQIEIH